ncbi:MAG: hypothetical protein KatS3mg111_3545 [Pirellulaceae bacterium]|nr:MAG: hypothetical protein KatS3mg111_3545 [Pirellulaceae bacterium]
MIWDYFVFLADNTSLQETLARSEELAGGFVDEVSVRFFQGDKENARNRYMESAHGDFNILDYIPQAVPDFSNLLSANWLAFQVDFELLTPWYSKDDRLFHVLDNPVRKDRIFGMPFMAASSWKGMLRWAFRMCTKLIGPEIEPDEGKRKQAQAWELHLFGNEKGEGEEFSRGALVFYLTWFNRIGFEVINPHSRERRAGTQPIYYEVVPPGTKGTLSILYAPWPGMKPCAKPGDVLPELLKAVEELLTTYGISAKRTVGWGTAKIEKWRAFHKTGGTVEQDGRDQLWQAIQTWLSGGGTL